jgi:hypothetical protein
MFDFDHNTEMYLRLCLFKMLLGSHRWGCTATMDIGYLADTCSHRAARESDEVSRSSHLLRVTWVKEVSTTKRWLDDSLCMLQCNVMIVRPNLNSYFDSLV